MGRRDGFNRGLVLLSFDGLNEYLGRHKYISVQFAQKNTVDLTATSNYEHYSVDTNDDKDQNYQLIITDDEECDKTEFSIETSKQ